MAKVLELRSAAEQVRRLKGLAFFPTDEVAVQELGLWLSRHAPSQRAAKEFIDLWLRDNTDAPKPSDIYAYFHPPSAYQSFETPKEVKCQVCGDTGFKIVERKNGITGAAPCDCRAARVTSAKGE